MISDLFSNAQKLLRELSGTKLERDARVNKTIELATLLLNQSLLLITPQEKKRFKQLSSFIQDPAGKTFILEMTDQCFRSNCPKRTMDQLLYLLKSQGIPKFLKGKERLAWIFIRYFGLVFPSFFVTLIQKKIQKEFESVLLPKNFELFLLKAKKQLIKINLNRIGEAILGEKEALARVQTYINDLKNPLIEYISIKISSIYSQVTSLSFEHSLAILQERLSLIYKTAQDNPWTDLEGERHPKFVNLDMEEYKDAELTIALFQKTLDQKEFLELSAGIVIQAYIPESLQWVQQIVIWAKKRVENGGAPIKIRLVKGANLSMEKIEASLKGWPLSTYGTKIETDANFKKLLEFIIDNDVTSYAHIGIGSHNLLDICYGLLLISERNVKHVTFEMLLGMAPSLQQVIHELTGEILLYCPTVHPKEFNTAIAYLFRRLDENTGKDHFLRLCFSSEFPKEEWEKEISNFKSACAQIDSVSNQTNRSFTRLSSLNEMETDFFINEPDTDFSLKENQEWVNKLLKDWREKTFSPIPISIDEKMEINDLQDGCNLEPPYNCFYKFSLASQKQLENAIACAKKTESSWGKTSFSQRRTLLKKVAHTFGQARSDLIGSMVCSAGKIITEADSEVSEAIDFINYYRTEGSDCLYQNLSPLGTILVTPPWNFPCSIPTGGISAALMAGNCVLFKPAPEAILIGWTLVQLFWKGGIPREVLQFVPCSDSPEGNFLIQSSEINGVILTGATATARHFLSLRPSLHLIGETGGKNAMILSSLCDRDLAIKDLVHSAFGHSGQKCSACSLAILEKELYEDDLFLKALKSAAKSLIVGSPWNKETKISPLIHPPEGALKRGITQLDEGESWLLEPKKITETLYTPGIKMGVKDGSWTHQTELFGPILGIMKAENFEHALQLANGTPYGLTSGLHSLDKREQLEWICKMEAGNLYINRTITGAIVRRQPFGGCKASSVGKGFKAGGPFYLRQFLQSKQDEPYVLNREEIQEMFSPKDPDQLQGQKNLYFLIPKRQISIRIGEKVDDNELFILEQLFEKMPFRVEMSCAKAFKNKPILFENDSTYLNRLQLQGIKKCRFVGQCNEHFFRKAEEKDIEIDAGSVNLDERSELLRYLEERVVSWDVHRYGTLFESNS